MKATVAFFGGIIVVLIGYPLIGMLVETYGFILLFSGFFPVAINFLRRVPVLGTFLNMPGISRVSQLNSSISNKFNYFYSIFRSLTNLLEVTLKLRYDKLQIKF